MGFWELPFLRFAWILPIAFALHEAEEWNILAWYREYWTNVGGLTNRTVWTHLGFVSLVGFAVTGACVAFRRPRIAAFLLLFFFGQPFVHSFLHVYWVPDFGAYSPGVVTAVLFLAPAWVLVALRAVRGGHVPAWFVALICALNLPVLWFGIAVGNTLPDGGLPWYQRSERIAAFLFGQP